MARFSRVAAPGKARLRGSVLFVLAAAILGAVVFGPRSASASSPSQKVWVVLVDRSLDSPLATRTDGVRAVALAGATAVKPRGRVHADGFTANALSRMTFPISADFSKPPPGFTGDNPQLIKLARDAQVGALAADALQILFPNLRVRGSDVIGALLATAKAPLGGKHGPALVLITSNMLDWSSEDDLFFTDSAPTSTERPRVLARLAAGGRIPDLHGACVLVVGAGNVAGSSIGTTRYQQVEGFWRAYFARAHAHVAGWLPRLPAKLPAPCGRR